MDWSPQQQDAITKVKAWLEDPGDQLIFHLFGYAGTGKTTLAKHLVEAVDGQVLFGAYTGKAALVLQEKGCYGASTIHSLIYIPREKSAERLAELKVELNTEKDQDRRRELAALIAEEESNLTRPAFNLNWDSPVRGASLLVLDEVSMVGSRIGKDICSFQTPILALGDPAQLPPVKDTGFFTGCEPDVLLTEIHRQAEGSPVLEIATMVREGRRPAVGSLGQGTQIIRKGILSIHELYENHDQIIVGRNRTRRAINHMVRNEVLERETGLPERGDRIVCFRNNREFGLMNGTQWIVTDSEILDEDKIKLWIRAHGEEDAYTFDVVAHRHRFEAREDEIKFYEMDDAADFDFAYAITCHKAQGSQWPRIAVVDESSCFRDDADKWLYTAVTRAATSMTLIR